MKFKKPTIKQTLLTCGIFLIIILSYCFSWGHVIISSPAHGCNGFTIPQIPSTGVPMPTPTPLPSFSDGVHSTIAETMDIITGAGTKSGSCDQSGAPYVIPALVLTVFVFAIISYLLSLCISFCYHKMQMQKKTPSKKRK